MHLVVLTPEEEVFKGEIQSIKVPGVNGGFEILRNHAPIVSALVSGNVRIQDSAGSSINFGIGKGFIEVHNNEVSLLVQGYKKAEEAS